MKAIHPDVVTPLMITAGCIVASNVLPASMGGHSALKQDKLATNIDAVGGATKQLIACGIAFAGLSAFSGVAPGIVRPFAWTIAATAFVGMGAPIVIALYPDSK